MRIVVGVCGGIAAYKAASLTSALVQRGWEVDIVMTQEAQRFIAPLTFSALTRRRVYTSLWDAPETIPHIALVREAQLLVVVPATANTIAKIAYGLADDLLSNCALVANIPIVVAPAMNTRMYEHPATAHNLEVLKSRGVVVVEPGVGFLAEREHGVGRLADESAILAAIDAVTRRHRDLDGERIVITAGPTREAIDPVRFLSNASSGATGIEIAREAALRGAHVDLVLGPSTLSLPADVQSTRVTTALEMRDATIPLAARASIVVATAAVADYRPTHFDPHKVKKSGDLTLALERTPDVLAEIGEGKNGAFVIGFAAETDDHERNAREKMMRKHLDAIVLNDVTGERGFGAVENELVVLHGADGRIALGRASKLVLARAFWDAIVALRKR